MFIISRRKRNMKKVEICKDCKRVIDGINVKGMKCNSCGETICYKCNLTYKCFDCYNDLRLEYYEEKPLVMQK